MLFAYRGNFVNNFLSSLSWGFFSLYSVVLLTSKMQSIYGWKREELLLMNGIYGIIIGFYHVFFSVNFDRFSQIIHMGNLDSVLVKPADSQFLLTFWRINFASVSRILIAFGYTMVLTGQMHLAVTPLTLLYFFGITTVSIILPYSFWFTATTCIMWFTKLSNITELLFTLTGTARYPQEMFREGFWYLFVFILTLTFIITTPAKVILQRLDMMSIVILFGLSGLLFFFSRWFWKFALRSYTSASS